MAKVGNLDIYLGGYTTRNDVLGTGQQAPYVPVFEPISRNRDIWHRSLAPGKGTGA